MKDDLTSAMWHVLVCISQGASGIDVRGGISSTTRTLERRGLIHAPGRWLRFELTERGKDLIGGKTLTPVRFVKLAVPVTSALGKALAANDRAERKSAAEARGMKGR